ncbi:MAG: hypothetical protein JWP97_2101 [Labilithrix sp.]|nr:hypothetical protein [Labilithrix sp.]
MRTTLTGLALALALAVLPLRAAAQPAPGGADAEIESLRQDERYAFCARPRRPLGLRQRGLCSLASQVPRCEALQAACGEAPPKPESTRSRLTDVLAAVGKILLWLLVLGVAAAVAFPLVRALLRARRDRRIAQAEVTPGASSVLARATDVEPDALGDAESTLREGDELARRGEHTRALGLYLAASLVALDRRGALRIARHRTNGEYVRACSEEPSRGALREIVREVDRVEFGKALPDLEGVARVRARAAAVVRGAVAIGALLVLAGCGLGSTKGPLVDDPAGSQLPMELLRHAGYDVDHLATSLAALPVPSAVARSPIVVLDVERVALEGEAESHLLRWVEGGGVLVLLGPAGQWPRALHARALSTAETAYDVYSDVGVTHDARAAFGRALSWPAADAFAFTSGSHTVVGAHLDLGKGAVVGLTNGELATNLGVSVPGNADALLALLHVAARDQVRRDEERSLLGAPPAFVVRFAKGEDGIAPPTNPFTALARSGLGKGAWHALAASLLLFLAYGIRHARARPTPEPTRRAFAEHVEATGAFYGRARAWPHALAAYGQFAALRLRDRLPRGADPAAFLASRGGVSVDEATRVWQRATSAKTDDATVGDEAETIRALRSLLARALR